MSTETTTQAPPPAAQHSPAPWTCDPWRSPADIKDANGETIAKVYLTDQTTRRRDDVHAVNARLMTTAPDLLAACKLLVRAYGSDGQDDDDSGDSGDSVRWEDLDAAHEAARQAIAKAEGR